MTFSRKLILVAAAGALAVGLAANAMAGTGHAKHVVVLRAAHGGGGGGGPAEDLAAAATYLGLTDAALQADLQAGKTLAQVAAATSGKSTDGLIAALVAAEKTEFAAAVTAGKLTQAQADAMTAQLTQRFTDLVNGTFPDHPGGPDGHGGPGGPGGPPGSSDDLAAAASYLGVSSAALATDLQSGKTLAQVASATSGKTTAGLIAALVTHETAEINARVTAGTETRAQADPQIAGLTARFTADVNDTHPEGGHGH
ncbi:MAG TPA: hypothetical protein VNY33_03495 [Gaiellaceae bacterium]|jgi:hypothetical protein|nr:hypothetical protein [Gaiellaceae bacterium]